ncbi:hypothetical protein DFH09DRAFT_1269257 [Mycena vulgaris]|nr:hypothetical protein DFH09DRAFT_1269257 [Mycena vulgaris]
MAPYGVQASEGLHIFDADVLDIPHLDLVSQGLAISWKASRMLYLRGIIYPARIHDAFLNSLDTSVFVQFRPLLVHKLKSLWQEPIHIVNYVPGLPDDPDGYSIAPYHWLNISSFLLKILVKNVLNFTTIFRPKSSFFTEKLEIFNQCISAKLTQGHSANVFGLASPLSTTSHNFTICSSLHLAGPHNCRVPGIGVAHCDDYRECALWEALIIHSTNSRRTLNILMADLHLVQGRPPHQLDPCCHDDTFIRDLVPGKSVKPSIAGAAWRVRIPKRMQPCQGRFIIVGNCLQLVTLDRDVLKSLRLENALHAFVTLALELGFISATFAADILAGGRINCLLAKNSDLPPIPTQITTPLPTDPLFAFLHKAEGIEQCFRLVPVAYRDDQMLEAGGAQWAGKAGNAGQRCGRPIDHMSSGVRVFLGSCRQSDSILLLRLAVFRKLSHGSPAPVALQGFEVMAAAKKMPRVWIISNGMVLRSLGHRLHDSTHNEARSRRQPSSEKAGPEGCISAWSFVPAHIWKFRVDQQPFLWKILQTTHVSPEQIRVLCCFFSPGDQKFRGKESKGASSVIH